MLSKYKSVMHIALALALSLPMSLAALAGPAQYQGVETKNVSPGRTFLVREGVQGRGGEAIIFLHGYPETSFKWVRLMKDLSENHGYHTIAFDQRGYSPGSTRPHHKDDYNIQDLVEDVVEVADELGVDEFHLVGHDWGSIIGWAVTRQFPNRVLSYTGMSMGHPRAFMESIGQDWIQTAGSLFYFNLYRLPGSAAIAWPLIETGLAWPWDNNVPFHVTAQNEYKRVLNDHSGGISGLVGALNWYRGNKMNVNLWDQRVIGDIAVTSTLLYDGGDFIARAWQAERTSRYVNASYRLYELNGVGHYPYIKAPESTKAHILDTIARSKLNPKHTQKVSFRTAHGKYFVNDGSGIVHANHSSVGPWEEMIISSFDTQGCIKNNDYIYIESDRGFYWDAKTNGDLLVNKSSPEAFRLKNHSDSNDNNCLKHNDLISLRGQHGKYVVAESNGQADANSSSIGAWEKFRVKFR